MSTSAESVSPAYKARTVTFAAFSPFTSRPGMTGSGRKYTLTISTGSKGSGDLERQVSARNLSFSLGLYKQSPNEQERPIVAVPKKRMYGDYVLFPDIGLS